MSYLTDLTDVALEAAAVLGPLKVEWDNAAECPGGPARPARLTIRSQKKRPQNIGGGTVTFYGHVDVGGNGDEIDGLNAIGRLMARALTDAAGVLATVRLAFHLRNEARDKQRAAEGRLERVLNGDRIRGRLHVALTETGHVWLQDPDKRDAGFGYRFDSLADLWRAHPDLRPVAWGEDERGPYLTVESFTWTPPT